MAGDDRYALGYEAVDDDPNLSVLVATMDATARWEATQELRRWERERLELAEGQRLLDVGCGLGDAALVLADDLGAGGEVVGIDRSSRMLQAARSRAATARCRTRFSVGDASSTGEPDDAFDAVRAERVLQWVRDPAAAVAELARVVRPGGRISLIDSDWSTFTIDVGDDDISGAIRRAMGTERRRPAHVGARLDDLARAAGLVVDGASTATQVWTTWDPDRFQAPDGCFSMASLADDLIDAGQLGTGDRDRFVATIHGAARRGRFTMALTMHAIVATAARALRR